MEKMTKEELVYRQNLPLDIKVEMTKKRIREWVWYYGKNNVYVSFSGGKDSTVLLHLVRQEFPSIPAVFVNTGLEFPELVDFVKKQENVTILRPEMSFYEVIKKYGYPVISKEQANYIYQIRHSTENMKKIRLEGRKGRYKLSKKYYYLLDAPFEISSECCRIMKKEPIRKYEKETGKMPIVGTMAEESLLREQSYLKNGCNSFDSKRPVSTPMGFWKQEDVLQYILENKLEIASVYGEIEKDAFGKLTTTGCKRTGCIYCGFGAQQEIVPTRYQLLEKTHPQLYKYCMETLGFKEVCKFMKIPYKNPKIIE